MSKLAEAAERLKPQHGCGVCRFRDRLPDEERNDLDCLLFEKDTETGKLVWQHKALAGVIEDVYGPGITPGMIRNHRSSGH